MAHFLKESAVYGERMVHRLQAMTDAILAIIATIMVLDIPLPKILSSGDYQFGATVSALLIFFVSFLIILSFYFRLSKFFHKIKKITGWQVFSFTFFLMALSLFPFLTQLNADYNISGLAVVYVFYVLLISRGQALLQRKVLQFNKMETAAANRFPWIFLCLMLLALLLFVFKYNTAGSLIMLMIPIRSLYRSIVIDEDL